MPLIWRVHYSNQNIQKITFKHRFDRGRYCILAHHAKNEINAAHHSRKVGQPWSIYMCTQKKTHHCQTFHYKIPLYDRQKNMTGCVLYQLTPLHAVLCVKLTVWADGLSASQWRRNTWWWSTEQAEHRATMRAAVLNVFRAASTVTGVAWLTYTSTSLSHCAESVNANYVIPIHNNNNWFMIQMTLRVTLGRGITCKKPN